MEIDGRVDERLDPVIPITVTNGLGESLTLDAVVDTGFNDVLSLPLAIIQRLNLQELPSIPVELADGSEVETDTFSGRILWNGSEQFFRIQHGEGRPLVGMALLLEHRVTIDVRYNGAVRVEPISDGDEEDN